jgi:parallel beta-helix repeat protein
VFYEGAHEFRIARNTVADNGYVGIGLNDAGNNRVEGNRVIGNGLSAPSNFDHIGGIIVNEDEIVDRNMVVGNRVGISTYCCANGGNHITRNRVVANGDGVIIRSGAQTLRRNRVSSNAHRGIVLIGWPGDQPGNRVEVNHVTGNGEDGIFVGGTRADEVLTGNGALANGDDGIDIETPSAVVAGNRVGRNADLGIEAVRGVVDGGQNRAFRNGNPLQCLNIFCR